MDEAEARFNPYESPAEKLPGPSQKPEKDIPAPLVIAAAIFIWVLIFGSVFGFATTSPCGFIRTLIGDPASIQNLENRTALNLHSREGCEHFLKITVTGETATQ